MRDHCGEQRLLSSCDVQAAHYVGFSCGAWTLELRLSSCGARAVAPQHAESFRTGDQTPVPCIGQADS